MLRQTRIIGIVPILLAALSTTSCAVGWQDEDGTRHTMGFGYFRSKQTPPNEGLQAVATNFRGLGAGVMAYGGDTRAYLGWIDDSQITIHDESTAVRVEGTAAKPFQLMVGSNPPEIP